MHSLSTLPGSRADLKLAAVSCRVSAAPGYPINAKEKKKKKWLCKYRSGERCWFNIVVDLRGKTGDGRRQPAYVTSFSCCSLVTMIITTCIMPSRVSLLASLCAYGSIRIYT